MYKKAKFFISGNELIKTEYFDIKELEKGFSIYEVVKITNSIPLFFEAHLNRLYQSAIHKNEKISFSYAEISEQVYKLISINKIKEGRLKFVVRFYKSENKLISFFLNPINPSENDYKNGINIQSYQASRINPNAKIINYDLRTSVNKLIRKNNIFEALLYNKNGIISECSKSNIFFIKNNIVYTSQSKDVLAGITRAYIINICKEQGIDLKECEIKQTELHNFNSVFITGTSVGVLPVKKIDNLSFNVSNHIIQKLSEMYQKIVNDYLLKVSN